MGYYRVTWGGYLEGEYESAEAAKAALVKQVEEEELDSYGRTWDDLIEVEEFNEETGSW